MTSLSPDNDDHQAVLTDAPDAEAAPVTDEPADADASSDDDASSDEAAASGEEVVAEGGTPDDVVDEDELLAPAPAESPFDRPGKWFVVHTQSGYEKKVKQNLEARTSSMNMEGRIHEVVIPMEDVIEFKNGKKVVVQKKMFPGYLLVR